MRLLPTLTALTAIAVAAAAAVAAPAAAQAPRLGARTWCTRSPTLTCTLTPTAGSSVRGTVTLTPALRRFRCGTLLAANVTGLAARSVHGWHVHEFGDVSRADGKATGGHFNPRGVDHALPATRRRHAGDLGNLLPASVAGVAVVRAQFSAALTTRAAVGRGLIIHALRDDGGQPTGNAGARLAQCVLGVAAPPPAPPAPPPPAAMLPVVVSPTTGGGGWYEAWLASLADFMGDRRGSA
ncbi:hypothetical protein BU14_0715s0006 [Porphyra umbilicalis]|uniref:Superoxide dismutase copper/zinc binding domain-containing protein n=1 Tax=Porphyra umbilicalis TaxID=2786 RepID=A0A1X6NPT2_PORUM|nr:hypothetical protein BU14_0715s0006 [Porphyra umbilicalis]|eukprot:OSX70592.1 hypothetical protein BU14_0715s0006 [Porphyra umbilicalis]